MDNNAILPPNILRDDSNLSSSSSSSSSPKNETTEVSLPRIRSVSTAFKDYKEKRSQTKDYKNLKTDLRKLAEDSKKITEKGVVNGKTLKDVQTRINHINQRIGNVSFAIIDQGTERHQKISKLTNEISQNVIKAKGIVATNIIKQKKEFDKKSDKTLTDWAPEKDMPQTVNGLSTNTGDVLAVENHQKMARGKQPVRLGSQEYKKQHLTSLEKDFFTTRCNVVVSYKKNGEIVNKKGSEYFKEMGSKASADDVLAQCQGIAKELMENEIIDLKDYDDLLKRYPPTNDPLEKATNVVIYMLSMSTQSSLNTINSNAGEHGFMFMPDQENMDSIVDFNEGKVGVSIPFNGASSFKENNKLCDCLFLVKSTFDCKAKEIETPKTTLYIIDKGDFKEDDLINYTTVSKDVAPTKPPRVNK